MGDYTSGFKLREMIQNSDNDAWAMIMDAVGYQQLRDYANVRWSKLQPRDERAKAVRNGHHPDGPLCGEAPRPERHGGAPLFHVTDTNVESLTLAATLADLTVFHKYGLLDGELPDAAVLANGTGAFAFVVYTQRNFIPERTDIIYQFTESVRAFF